jgi:hypothetical protein
MSTPSFANSELRTVVADWRSHGYLVGVIAVGRRRGDDRNDGSRARTLNADPGTDQAKTSTMKHFPCSNMFTATSFPYSDLTVPVFGWRERL